MASTKQPSRVVFVGNIPYGLSEEQIIDIFSSAGKVLSFRLVYDQQTGKTRGYGFAEYPDIDSASSAVRNLHDYEVMGRKLRVDFSNEGPSGVAASASGAAAAAAAAMPATHGAAASASNGGPLSGSGSGASSLPPLPPGKELPPGVTCHDAISRTLSALPPSQLLDILQQMKTLSLTEPARCAELLSQAPQLSYAVFQALLLMGLISPEAIHSVVEGPAAPPYAVAQPAPPPAASAVTSTPPVAFPPGGGGPGLAAAPYGMPVQPAAAVPAPAPPQDPEALMKAVMALSQSTIDSLPENERQQVMQLRAAFSAQRR